jgi:hypothetical protein
MTRQRVTVREASGVLGISEHAIRQRIRRGTLESDKDADGRVYVLLDLDTELSGEPSDNASGGDPVHEMLREQNQMLREQLVEAHAANRENRRIIAALTQRIPELEATTEPREAPVTPSQHQGDGVAPPEPERRSWWQRLFSP